MAKKEHLKDLWVGEHSTKKIFDGSTPWEEIQHNYRLKVDAEIDKVMAEDKEFLALTNRMRSQIDRTKKKIEKSGLETAVRMIIKENAAR